MPAANDLLARHSGHPYCAADNICRRDVADQVTKVVKLKLISREDWVAPLQELLDALGVTGHQRDPFFEHAIRVEGAMNVN